MSGHSKWSQIKRQKGAADARRGRVFSKLANLITVAARAGGGDPVTNPRLRMAVDQARAENMPKDNIERAIKRGTGELGGAMIEELRFEAYGPAGIGIVIEVTTDNRQRANAAVKAVLNRSGGKLAATGAVAYQFAQRGVLVVPMAGRDREALELALIEAGATDYEEQRDTFLVYTEPKATMVVKQRLENQGITVAESRLELEPTQTVAIADESAARTVLKLMEALEDLDDVTVVTANFEIPEEILARISND